MPGSRLPSCLFDVAQRALSGHLAAEVLHMNLGIGVAALGLGEDLGQHLCGVAGDAGGQPLVVGDRAGCGVCARWSSVAGRMSAEVRGAGLAS